MWFKQLTGFEELSPKNVRDNILIEGNAMVSKVNNRRFQFGMLDILSLGELKELSPSREGENDHIRFTELVGDVKEMHCDPANKHALFQAASQFNLLEMIGPHVTPESGIDGYERDYTQGPVCAIACGAGTIYRNYFAPVNGRIGQSADNQIDCLALIGKALKNNELRLWEMSNGYALVTKDGLLNINSQLNHLGDVKREQLKEKLQIGLQWDTEVTLTNNGQLVSQAYCSALPVAYSYIESIYWESFAKIILEAAYEATLYAALINLQRTGCDKVFLTLVGGGAFGNEMEWIVESLSLSISKFKHTPLNVHVVSYQNPNPFLQELLDANKR